jgi:hypothetical protein
MQIFNSLLAQMTPETAQQIEEIHQKINNLPYFAFYDIIWLLPVFITVGIVLLFQRQKKIAQNQVDLAKMVEQLLEKNK